MLLKGILIGISLLLFSFCCGVEGTPVIQGPSEVIFRPNEGPVELTCIRNTTEGSILWRVNGSAALTPSGIVALFPGHVDNGTSNLLTSSLLIVNATNNTKYICVSFGVGETDSEPVYLYIAAAPDMIGSVMIDLDTVNVDDNVSFTLSWNEPFANFDPIVNYTVTISCTNNATCPVIVNTDNVTRTAIVNFITDLSMMTTLSVTATNTIGKSDPATRIITAPGDVNITSVMCEAVDFINQCRVYWNATMYGDNNTVAAPVSYNVSYFGDNIENGSVEVNRTMAIIDLPAMDSDVNVFVTAINVFGRGGDSEILMDEIMAPSVIEAVATLVTPNVTRASHSITVTCTVRSESNATLCVVMAMAVGRTTRSGMAAITNGMATVTVDGLMCNVTYNITAGGTLNGTLVGPLSSHGNITSGPCEPPTPTPSVVIPPMNTTSTSVRPMGSVLPPGGQESSSSNNHTGAIVGGVVGGICGAILLIVLIILLWFFCIRKRGEKSSRATSPGIGGEKGGTGVKVHTLDRYGKPIPLEGENTDTGVELTGYATKSPEFTVSQVPATTFQGNDYQSEEKNRTPSAYVPEGSYDTLAPADEPTAPSAEVVPPANGQSNPNAPKLNYADLEQFTRKPASVKKPEPQPASQYAVIDPKSLQQQGTYT